MSTPADDCGVTGGCHACPLFAANVCGDPAPEGGPAVRRSPEEALADAAAFGSSYFLVEPDAPVEPEQLALFELPGMWEGADFLGGEPDEVRPPAEPVDPDAPDVDPNEPRPEGAGCCGGACAA
ncbi:hypothetical protein [Micromonospora sp. NPDC023956]|uniref:hypothetical protein n=1 Tax=Micromonospora sp. NPDC023956 TaxID=3155722 RepID=UPI0033C4F280